MKKLAGKKKHYEKGAVLIIVLFIISGLAVVSVELNRNVLLDHAFSITMEAGLASKPLLKSGESIAAYFLVRDFQKEKNEPGQESLQSLQKRLCEWVEAYSDRLKKWNLQVEVEDENSRFPLRALFPAYKSEKLRAEYHAGMLENMIVALLVAHGYEGGENAAKVRARHYVEQLLAWGGEKVLTDEAARWYKERTPAYYPPLRAPENISELLLVYWPDVEQELARKVMLGSEEAPGLLDNCSLWSIGPININTMKTVVGWGLCSTLNQAWNFMAELEKGRAAQGEWLRPGWYADIFAAHAVLAPPANVLDEQSRWFRIRVLADRGSVQNYSEVVGWMNKTRMTWVSRTVL